jgi:signal peptide peptidase SppA
MKSTRFLSFVLAHPWAMEPTAMQLYAAMLTSGYAHREGIEAADVVAKEPFAAAVSRSGGARQGGIAVIQVFGPIVQRASQLGMCESGVGADDIGKALASAMADDTIGQVLLEFDTPGGSVFGVGELADQIRSMRTTKPIVGISNSLCASAGYWLLSQCSEAYCTPGGMVGSIGVYTAHQDISKALEMAGMKVTLISAGKFKTEGSPLEPLGDDAKASTQASVDDYYSMFTGGVAKGRSLPVSQVRDGMGQGRVLGADAALAEKMIDGVMTFPEVIKKMQRNAKSSGAGARADAVFAPGASTAQPGQMLDGSSSEGVSSGDVTAIPESAAKPVRSAQANRNELALLSL